MKISMKLVYKYMAFFYNFSPTSSHLHPPQVENRDSDSRLVVDEDDNGKFRDERVKGFFQFHHKCLNKFSPLHLNTYVIDLRPLEIIKFLQCENRL